MGCTQMLLLVAVILEVHFHGSEGWLEEEKRALLDFKESFFPHNASMNHNFLTSWVSDPYSNSCDWERVTCNFSSNQVIHLSLSNLTGIDPYGEPECPAIVTLNISLFLSFNHLTSLNLSYNCFGDLIRIEDSINKSMFTMLETLDLSDNSFWNVSIIGAISVIPSLKNLYLARCSIIGPLPIQELSVLQNLELLDLSWNFFSSPSSTIQDTNSWSKLKRLKTLDLSVNLLDQNIFKYLNAVPSLTYLFLSSNDGDRDGGRLNDKVLTNLTNLKALDLWKCGFSGPLPIQGLCKMKQLLELDLSINNFIGTLDTCLGNLTLLRALDLSSNSLSGSIPTSFIAPLVSLEYLSLSKNNFEGLFSLNSIANHSKLKLLSLGKMNNSKIFQVETENPSWSPSFQLEYLEVTSCQVNLPTRTVPTFLLYQHGLKHIDFSHNNLVGMFPNWLLVNNSGLNEVFLNDNSFDGLLLHCNLNYKPMDQLHALELSNNRIHGKLPKNIGYFLPHLEYLNVSSNMFDGDIPASIGKMSNLMVLDLAYNNFSGEIPKNILLGCISLCVLKLSNNRFQGQIFSTPMSMRSLAFLLMDNNQFDGTLEDGSKLTLKALDISSNNFSGILPTWIVKSPLNVLSASNNNLEGAIPMNWCNNTLELLDLSHNRFFGVIPSCLFTFSLRFLHLRGNKFTGSIPQNLSGSSKLVTVDLRDNKISGSIPESIYGLSFLKFLILAGNELEGHLSNKICQLRQINILDLSRNNFIGFIPSCFNDMTFGNQTPDSLESILLKVKESVLFYSDNYQYAHFYVSKYYQSSSRVAGEEVQFVTKSLPYSYKGNMLLMMSGLDLSSNKLIGKIPYQIGDLLALHTLNLSHNYLNGTIPESFCNLKAIESLDLSYNNLEGQIPLQLQDLNSLSTFNVSYNNLSGRAPDQGQFGTFDDNSYKGNPDLCWSNSNRRIATPPSLQTPLNVTQRNEPVIDVTTFYWSFGAAYVMVLLTLVTILWINTHWRRAWFYYISICLHKSFGWILKDVILF